MDGENNLISECTAASFRADVMTESGRQPVLVDFWAPWCEPCKALTPLLEKIVTRAAGKVKLVKMNIEAHPQIAAQLGIESLPAVYAFQKGQPVDGFMGALPENQIKAFLERLVGPLGGDEDDLIREAGEALAAGNAAGAVSLYSQGLIEHPANVKMIAGLANSHLALANLGLARDTLASTPSGFEADPLILAAKAALDNAERAESAGDIGDLQRQVDSEPANHQARLNLAVALNARGEREKAADALLDIIRRDKTWSDGAARKQLLLFFEAWGHMDTDTLTARRKLSGYLFS